MLLNANLVGQQDQWAQFVTRADQHDRPLMKMIRAGDKPVNVLYRYQAKTYNAPVPTNQPEGKDWTTFGTPDRRVEMKARVQRFDATGAVSDAVEDVHNVAGVDSEIADDMLDRIEEMNRGIECWIGSDKPAYEEDGVTQNQTQAIGLWIQSGTTSQVYVTPAKVRPPAANIYGGTIANFNEPALRALLQSQWKATGQSETIALILGWNLKEIIDGWATKVVDAAANIHRLERANRSYDSKVLGYEVQTYRSTYGTLETHLDRWLANEAFGGTAGKASYRGYGIHPERWALMWNKKPQVQRLPFEGGSYKWGAYCRLTLACFNPIGELKIDPSDA